MDGLEGMKLSGSSSSSYYFQRGVSESDRVSGLYSPPGLRPLSNLEIPVQSNVGEGPVGSAFPVENPSSNFPHGHNTVVPAGEPAKRKRGRPRKYGPERTNMALALSPLPLKAQSGSIIPKRGRGRPPGSGWKQQLAPLGEWMNSSAGLAFTPHIIYITEGEDIASKIWSFSQQRPRAVCILSANGVVSAVTLHQHTSSGSNITYEGRFQILCLSGSYLVAESGGPHNRTGGLSVSLCSPDGHVIGGGVGGMLTAGSTVQVVLCSFVYGGSKPKDTTAISPNSEGEKNCVLLLSGEKSGTPASAACIQNLTPNSSVGVWPGSRPNLGNMQREIDLMHG